jgi:hypothetical protein
MPAPARESSLMRDEAAPRGLQAEGLEGPSRPPFAARG